MAKRDKYLVGLDIGSTKTCVLIAEIDEQQVKFLALGAAESVVGISDAYKPYPDLRGLYRLNTAASARAGGAAINPHGLKAVASAAAR